VKSLSDMAASRLFSTALSLPEYKVLHKLEQRCTVKDLAFDTVPVKGKVENSWKS